jgi:hypothetical protein
VAAGSGRIYSAQDGYIRLGQNQQSWIQNLRAKTQRFEDPMSFEVWKMTRRHQRAKMEEVHAQSKPTKTRLSDFFRLSRVLVGFGDFVCLGKIW